MKIRVRVPTEQYAYIEVEYDSLEEYKQGYPEFTKAVVQVRKKVKEEKTKSEVPFEG